MKTKRKRLARLDKVVANKFVNEVSYEVVRNWWRVREWSVVLPYHFNERHTDVLFNDTLVVEVSNNRVLFPQEYSFFRPLRFRTISIINKGIQIQIPRIIIFDLESFICLIVILSTCIIYFYLLRSYHDRTCVFFVLDHMLISCSLNVCVKIIIMLFFNLVAYIFRLFHARSRFRCGVLNA